MQKFINKKLKNKIIESVSKIIEDISLQGYNSPFYQTNSKEDIIKNFDAHNKNRTSFDAPTKQSVESAVKGAFHSDENWYKVNSIGTNKNISKATNRNLLSENFLLNEADNDNQQNNQQLQNNNTNDNQQNNHEDPLDFLYDISRRDAILLYNGVFVPFFAFWKNSFHIKDKKARFAIFDLYIQCNAIFLKLNEKEILETDAKNHFKYTKLQNANNSLLPAINLIYPSLDSKLITEVKTEIDTIKSKIQNGIDVITKSLYQTLLPVSNGYIQALEGVKNKALNSLGNGAKQNDVINKTIKEIQDSQKHVLLNRFKYIDEQSSGNWLSDRVQGILNNFKPQININVEGKEITNQFNLLKDNPDIQNYINQFKKPFDEIINVLDEYNKKFHEFVTNIDIKKIKNIETRIDATAAIIRELKSEAAGMFNNVTKTVAQEIADKLKVYTKNNEEEKKKNDEEQEKASLNTTKGYLLKTLGFNKDNLKDEELDYAEIVTRNYTTFKIKNEKLEFKGLDKYTQPEQLHEIVLNTIRGKGSLFEFTQNWFVIAHKYELILWSANKMNIDNILRNYLKENGNKTDENQDLTEKTIPSLTESLGETQMSAYSNGHDLKWQANRATAISLKYLDHYGYVKDLAKLPENFWSFIFDDNFKKDKLFTDSQINNQEDIEKAEKKFNNEKQIRSENPFNDYLNKFVNIMRSLDSDTQTNLKVSNFKQLVNKYSNNLKQTNENDTNIIGNITSKFLIEFLNKYGKELKPQNNSLADHKSQAKYLSEKLLNAYYGKNLKREQIDELSKGIEGLLDNPQNGTKYKNSLGDVLKCLNKILNYNVNNYNQENENNNDYENDLNDYNY